LVACSGCVPQANLFDACLVEGHVQGHTPPRFQLGLRRTPVLFVSDGA
jgi:hypothetical protein